MNPRAIPVTSDEFYARHEAIKPYIHRTPVLTSAYFNNLTDADIYFKCENFQRMGAFKMRGAASAMTQLSDEQRERGVVTHSSGNFAQAVSLAARMMDLPAYIVMPENAPQVKKDAVRGYGGQITECDSIIDAREATAAAIAEREGAAFLHSSDDLDVILGQGTAAAELIEEYPDLDYIFVPVGGGGLVAGACLAAHFADGDIQVVGGEPAIASDAYQSLQAGEILRPKNGMTIADGLRTYLGEHNFPIIQHLIDRIILVEEDDIVTTMRDVYQRMKIIIEPSCAVPLAALISEKEKYAGKKIGIILSGGNVDFGKLPF